MKNKYFNFGMGVKEMPETRRDAINRVSKKRHLLRRGLGGGIILLISTLSYGQISWTGERILADGEVISQDINLIRTVTINVPSGSATISGVMSGNSASSVRKTGDGTLILTGNNTYTTLTTIIAGTISIGNNTNTGAIAGNIVNNANLIFNRSNGYTYSGVISGTGSVIKKGSLALFLEGNNTYTGITTISEGALYIGYYTTTGSIAGNIVNNSNLFFSLSNEYTYSGVISGSGNVHYDSEDKVTLSGINTYTGETRISGPLVLSTVGSIEHSKTVIFYTNWASFNISSGNKTIKSLNGDYASSQVILGIRTLTIGTSATSEDGGGTFRGVISGIMGNIIKTGTDTLFLTGNNTYPGSTTINAGTLSIGNNTTTGAIDGNIVNNANLIFNRSNGHTYSGVISGTGTVTKLGNSILRFTGNNTYTGTTTISEGNLYIGFTTTTGAIAGNIVNNGVLHFYRFNDYTYSGSISGTGNVINYSDNATLTLNGINTYTGITYIEAPLALGTNGTIENSSSVILVDYSLASFNISSGNKTIKSLNGDYASSQVILGSRTLTIGTSATSEDGGGTFNGIISGTGGITKTGTAELVLTGTNTYTGITTIESGSISIGMNTTTGNIIGDIINNGEIYFRRTNPFTYSGVISGTGTVCSEMSSSAITFTKEQTYTGITLVRGGLILSETASIENSSEVQFNDNFGTFEISSGNKKINSLRTTGNFPNTSIVLGSGVLTIGNAGQADGGGNFSGIISGTGGITKTGSANLTLSGQNSATGTLTVQQGKITLASKWQGNFNKENNTELEIQGNVNIGGSATLSGGNIYMDLKTDTPARMLVSGIMYPSGTNTLNITCNDVANYALFQAASGIIASPFRLNIPGTLEATGNQLLLTADAVGIGELGIKNNELRVYPNPTNGEFKVSGSKFKDGTQSRTLSEVEVAVEIFNMTGRYVGAYSIRPDGLVDISHLPAGVYMLRVGNETIRIVKK